VPDTDLTEYLKPDVLAKVDNLELIAKFIVEGFLIGLHRSPYHGFSVEFSSYRKYVPGDDMKFVDWRVFGRTDKYYVKQFEENTNLNCFITMDISASMNFADPGPPGEQVSKFRYSTFIAAGLAYLMLRQGDAVSLVGFNSEEFSFLPPSGRSNRLIQFLTALSRLEPKGETALRRSLGLLAERIKGRSLVILISDLLVEPGELAESLHYFRYKNHEVVVFHVLADAERNFPFTLQTNFVDMETNREILTEASYIRDEYLSLLRAHTARLKDTCEELDVDFVPLSTSSDLGEVLVAYLAKRMTYV